MVRPLLLTPLLVVASVVATAQQRPDAPVLSIRSDLVILAVTVVDEQGGPVAGLRQDAFTVFDNGERRSIALFASDDLPAAVTLLVDGSGSMRAHRRELTPAIAAFTAARHPLDEFTTRHFTEHLWIGLPPGAYPPAGLTALFDALDRSLRDLAGSARDRRAVIAVSDGGDNASARTIEQVTATARHAGTPIYGVTLVDPDNREARPAVLKALAGETGGRTFAVRRAGDLPLVFQRIAGELRSGYIVGFEPPDAPGAGFRSIRVRVTSGDGRALTARTRAGYHADSR